MLPAAAHSAGTILCRWRTRARTWTASSGRGKRPADRARRSDKSRRCPRYVGGPRAVDALSALARAAEASHADGSELRVAVSGDRPRTNPSPDRAGGRGNPRRCSSGRGRGRRQSAPSPGGGELVLDRGRRPPQRGEPAPQGCPATWNPDARSLAKREQTSKQEPDAAVWAVTLFPATRWAKPGMPVRVRPWP
jgi:hypothetical protein